MQNLFIVSATVAALTILPVLPQKEALMLPISRVATAKAAQFPVVSQALPSRLLIPSIGLNVPVEQMGVNDVGQLDVPAGSTNTVGWYAAGTVPGEIGSAVMDAHVYAALKKLNKTKVGQDIYVETDNGVTLRFKITEKKTLPLAQVSSDELFNRASGRELHLITCAGTYSKQSGTYSHRLLVYATLVN